MTGHLYRVHLNRLIQQLEVGPAWLHHDPPCALWLDGHRRMNLCSIDPHAIGTPLVRISVNKRPLHTLKQRDGWPERVEINPAAPQWRLEIICHSQEAGDFAEWLASVVSRREGYLRRLPAPPFPILHWEDLDRLDDYLYYLSAVSLWSERAFHEDIKWGRLPAAAMAGQGSFVSIPVTH